MLFLRVFIIFSVFFLSSCDDLNPSGKDMRGSYSNTSTGSHPGQLAPDFAVFDTLNNTFVLSSELVGSDAVVLYFTMWCPICDSHMTHMRNDIIPLFPNVKFLFLDYVSGIVSVARAAQLDNGYGTSRILVDDINHTVTDLYNGTMGTTIVIDASGTVLMNEDYKDGRKLLETLNSLP